MKVVYVIIGNEDSIYLEQAYASIWSLKYYNPDMYVTVVMDNKTSDFYNRSNYSELDDLINEKIFINFNDSISNIERSRFLKTTLRKIITGTFLFLDTDTIVVDSISELQSFKYDIGAVPDFHHDRSIYNYTKDLDKKLRTIFNLKISDYNLNYYNSGVMFVKDSEIAHELYDLWHKNWIISKNKNCLYDQPALITADIQMGGVIKTLDNIYNYQICNTMKFLLPSKIIHFYNAAEANKKIHPFFNDNWYKEIKCEGGINKKKKSEILSCKTLFPIDSQLIVGNNLVFWRSALCTALSSLNTNGFFFKLLNSIPSIYFKFKRKYKK